jgi:hypothetical protein
MASGESAFKKPSGFHKSDIGLFKSNITPLNLVCKLFAVFGSKKAIFCRNLCFK